ncbi:DUF4407 domain-containing protein [Nocardia kruczakiae]|uniref:DUF4407 domain-containing protein n=1 Tax=Nocardia kruczakiae TaxID=261477 RepID=UPI0012EDBD57|nr:DUF4407 domain-containing protein [Nocardia kruczakiae]
MNLLTDPRVFDQSATGRPASEAPASESPASESPASETSAPESPGAGSPTTAPRPTSRRSPIGALTWLGGAEAGRGDRHEASAYAVTGGVVLLFAVLSGIVVAAAGAAAHWPAAVVAIVALPATLLVGAISRALATAPLSDRGGRGRAERFGRIAVAVITGVLVAELASTVILAGSVDRTLDDRSRRDAESAATVVTARTELDRATAERAALTQTIAQAQADMDQALVVARCEYNPTPQCPQTKITGVPGRGPESQTANAMLDDARGRFNTAQARIQPSDAEIAARQSALEQARTAAFRTGDRGLGARWLAMNDYTAGHIGALLLRLLTIAIAVVLALLPLILRSWRGESSFDRAVAARAEADRAARAADTAVAVQHAEHRVAAAQLALHADTAIDRERQRKRVIAAIGNLEIGITEPQRRAVAEFEALAALPPGAQTAPNALPAAESTARTDPLQEATVTARNLPAQLPSTGLAPNAPAAVPAPREDAKKGGGLELPVIGTVPFTDTAARWIRPLVPGFVTSALDRTIDTATAPLRTVRQVFEEAEEITFTLKRTRKVTVNSEDSHDPAVGYAHPGQALPNAPYAQVTASYPYDAYQHDPRYAAYRHDPRYARYAALPYRDPAAHPRLPESGPYGELPAPDATELGYRAPRELPPGSGRD